MSSPCYRSTLSTVVALTLFSSAAPYLEADEPVKVFILAGQSNMEGKAKISLLEYQLSQPETKQQFQHLRKHGQWVKRDDVWIKFLDRMGHLTVGFGSPNCIGPELEFGNTVGDYSHPTCQTVIRSRDVGQASLRRTS